MIGESARGTDALVSAELGSSSVIVVVTVTKMPDGSEGGRGSAGETSIRVASWYDVAGDVGGDNGGDSSDWIRAVATGSGAREAR